MDKIKVIGFDADDTLWVNEPYYREAEERFIELMSEYGTGEDIEQLLFETEMANLKQYGYGIKAFMLSMVECAIRISGGKVRAGAVSKIIELGKEMLQRPIQLLDDVSEVLKSCFPHYRLIVATKGDLLDQEAKMKRSGIGSYFHHIEVMSDKKKEHYSTLLNHLDIQPEEFLMIGNSIKSDILPPLELGCVAIHVPYHTTWAHEEVDSEPEQDGYFRVSHLKEVLELIPLTVSR